jgi:hypothetical protein
MFLFSHPCLRQQRRKELFVPLGSKEEALLTHNPEEINQQPKKKEKQTKHELFDKNMYLTNF